MDVIIVGCGIAGPVLAMLLQKQGYKPIIYERQPKVEFGGIAIILSPQTFKVLNILGLAEGAIARGRPLDAMRFVAARATSQSTADGEKVELEVEEEELAANDVPTQIRAGLGWPMLGISRTVYNAYLYEAAVRRGIEVQFGKPLVHVRDTEGDGEGMVSAVFEDGTVARAGLLVGCDGLHSAVRASVFGKEEPSYMGIVQIGGLSTLPPAAEPSALNPNPNTFLQIYGDGAHFITYQISAHECAWASTLPQPTEAREDWRHVSQAQAGEMARGLAAAKWESAREVMERSTRVIKLGLYVRPILPVWHKGRVVLAGDAAHPTSPHLGQGANQAVEDCYHIVRLLQQHAPPSPSTPSPPTLASLQTALSAYSELRVPRVTHIVAQAQKEGLIRTARGEEAGRRRDEHLRQGMDREGMRAMREAMSGPFVGESEI